MIPNLIKLNHIEIFVPHSIYGVGKIYYLSGYIHVFYRKFKFRENCVLDVNIEYYNICVLLHEIFFDLNAVSVTECIRNVKNY